MHHSIAAKIAAERAKDLRKQAAAAARARPGGPRTAVADGNARP